MNYHRNTLLYSYEGKSNYSNTYHTKKMILVTLERISLVTPEDKFVCHAQVIITNRDQGRKLGPDTSRIYTDHDYNIIGFHRKALLTDDIINKVYNPDIDMSSKPNIEITQCAKYLFNETLNLSTNTPSSNFSCTDYVTHTTLPKDRK